MQATTTVVATLATDPTLPAFFLGHLSTLVDEQARATDPQERVTLSIALFSAFLDCAALGLHDEARRIMARFHGQGALAVGIAA